MNALITSLVIGLLKWLVEASKPQSTEGVKKGALEDRLRAKIKKDGWK